MYHGYECVSIVYLVSQMKIEQTILSFFCRDVFSILVFSSGLGFMALADNVGTIIILENKTVKQCRDPG